ncbi:MAG: hypothetical protein LBG81_00950, partial [Coriobacteriaceae bacterium]|nr:hypothetical protein [Coriobacteriaceae bacterium]
NGGTTQGKGSPQGGGMAKTGDGLGMLATGAAAMALAALITLLAALIPASLRRQNMIGEGLVKGSAERGLVKG